MPKVRQSHSSLSLRSLIALLGQVAGSSSDVQKQLSQQMAQISEQHQKQLSTLREEIRGKETQMEALKE